MLYFTYESEVSPWCSNLYAVTIADQQLFCVSFHNSVILNVNGEGWLSSMPTNMAVYNLKQKKKKRKRTVKTL